MTKKVIIQLEVEFDELTADERVEIQDGSLYDDEDDGKMPTLADYNARELASVFDAVPGVMFQELFGGSDVYAKIKNTSVLKAHFAKR